MRLKRYFSWLPTIFKEQTGIGLAETLVAIAILGVSAVSFISNLSAGAISVRTLNEETVVQQLLTSEMETLRGVTYDVSGTSYPIISSPSGYTLTIAVNSSIYSNNNIQKITVLVWHDGVQAGQLESYKVKK
jgi:hypothetical protein